MRLKYGAEQAMIYVLLAATGLLILYPVTLIFLTSLKTNADFMGNPTGWPAAFTFDNYVQAWQRANFHRYYGNSLLVTLMSVLGITLFGSMAAYALRRPFRGSGATFNYFLIGIMIPAQTTIITTFIFLKQTHLLSTYTGLILVYIAHQLPLAIFIFAGFFRTVPKELEEAAMLDGCSEIGTFVKIMLPISRPIIATVVILTGLAVWNDFFLPLILMLDSDKHTLPVGLLRLRGEFSTDWPVFFSAMGMLIAPVIIAYLFLQKQFIKGLTSGSVKG